MSAAAWSRLSLAVSGLKITRQGVRFSHSRFRCGRVKMAGQTILLIDDDEILLEMLSDHVRTAGYRCLVASSGVTGLQVAGDAKSDLVVLDVMMPGMNGWEVCRHLRSASSVSIIMLTAKGEEIDKLYGFRLGVDDYVTKPFSFAELVARIGAVLARSKHRQESG